MLAVAGRTSLLARFDLHQWLLGHRLCLRTHAPGARHPLLLGFLRLDVRELAGVGLDLDEVRRPFDPDRFGWGKARPGRDGS